MSKVFEDHAAELQPGLQRPADPGAALEGSAPPSGAHGAAAGSVAASGSASSRAPAPLSGANARGVSLEPAGDLNALEPRCKCGALGHELEPGICARGHAMPGNIRALKHGLRSDRAEPEAPDPADWRESWPGYRRIVHRHIESLSKWLTERPSRVRSAGHIRTLLDLVRQARDLDRELQAEDDAVRQARADAEVTSELQRLVAAVLEVVAAQTDADQGRRIRAGVLAAVGRPALAEQLALAPRGEDQIDALVETICGDPGLVAALTARLAPAVVPEPACALPAAVAADAIEPEAEDGDELEDLDLLFDDAGNEVQEG